MSLSRDYSGFLGKHYIEGLQDCFDLFREVYAKSYKIDLINYARPTNWETFPEFDYLRELYLTQGFSVPTNNPMDLREGDGLLMSVASNKINHCAIYIGEGKILHHLYGKFSSIDPYTYPWQNRVRKVIRHREREQKICRSGPQLIELLPEHLQLRLARRMEALNDKP